MGRPNTMGLTRRDVERIKALAESVTDNHAPAALADLDAPWRVAAIRKTDNKGSGEVFGEWAGRLLVAWWKPGPAVACVADYQAGEKAALAALRRAAPASRDSGA